MSAQIKNVLKTDSKAYGVSGINIHYGSLCKVVRCTTKHLLHSLNISWWPAGTFCHLHRREEKARGTFSSLLYIAWHRSGSYWRWGAATHCLWPRASFCHYGVTSFGLLWEGRSGPSCGQGCKYSGRYAVGWVLLQSGLQQLGQPPPPGWGSTGWTGHTGAPGAAPGTHLSSSSCESRVALLKCFSWGFEYWCTQCFLEC